MEIIVCVKQVADAEAHVEVGADGSLSVEDRWATSYFDEVAIEQALLLRQELGGTVTAITAGAGKSLDALRRAIAMGANRAIMIDDAALAGADGLGVARALAAVISGEPADLILCGKASLDQEAGVVGPALAELLGFPHLAEVVELQVVEDGATALREVEGGRAKEHCSLPAVLTVGKGLAEPRVPPVTGVMKAMRAPIDRRSLADLGVDPDQLTTGWRATGHAPPPAREAVQMVAGELPASAHTLLDTLRDKGVL